MGTLMGANITLNHALSHGLMIGEWEVTGCSGDSKGLKQAKWGILIGDGVDVPASHAYRRVK